MLYVLVLSATERVTTKIDLRSLKKYNFTRDSNTADNRAYNVVVQSVGSVVILHGTVFRVDARDSHEQLKKPKRNEIQTVIRYI